MNIKFSIDAILSNKNDNIFEKLKKSNFLKIHSMLFLNNETLNQNFKLSQFLL